MEPEGSSPHSQAPANCQQRKIMKQKKKHRDLQ